LSELAQSYKDAGGARESQATRDLLSQTLRMRTLVASLWTYDANWSASKLPVSQRIDEEKRRYAQAKKEWDQRYSGRTTPILAPADRAHPMPPPLDPPPHADRGADRTFPEYSGDKPPDRSTELKNATAQRYREIYIHSKLMLIDDSMFTLGSANLNLRSFAVDSEINIASDDAHKATDLRQRVWHQHTRGRFDGGGDATEQAAMGDTFDHWEKEGSNNLNKKANGLSLTSFLVKFLDERTSTIRVG